MTRKLQSRWLYPLIIILALTHITVAAELDLGLQDAIELALEHNLDFRLVTLDWEQTKAALERAHIVEDEEMIKEAQEMWKKANKFYEEQKRNLENQVRIAYQELLERETMVANGEKAWNRAENQLAIDENKYKAGLLSTLDIQRAENSLFDAEYRYEASKRELKTQQMKFNELLGLSFNQEVNLTERLLLDFVPFTLDLETCYDLAFRYDNGLLTAKENLHEAKEKVLLAQSPFAPRVELEMAQVGEEKAEIRLQKAEQDLYFRIRRDYYSLMDQAHNLQVKEAELELERKNLQAEESKYAAGVLSNAQIVAQQEKLAQLEQDYSADLLNYSLARMGLLQTIGKEDAWSENHEK